MTKEEYNNNPKKCKRCGKILSWKQRFNQYCGHSCATIINNAGIARNRKSIGRFCKSCGKELDIRHKNFCSHKCKHNFEQKEYIKRWKNGLETGLSGKYQVSDRIRRYFLDKYNCKCQKCGWGEINPTTGRIPLQLHHIDGNCQNNKEENLELLCPNCHSLTENFGSLNKNATRIDARKRY